MAQLTECPPGEHRHGGQADTAGGQPEATGGHPISPAPGYPYPYQEQRVDRFTAFMERVWSRPAWLLPVVLLGCVTSVGALLLASDPTDGRQDGFGGCAFKALTGFDCPGCGGTRALWYLLHANLPEAARHHLFAVFAAPFIVYAYLAWAGQRIFQLNLPQLRIAPKAYAAFGIGWGLYWVIRNLPWAPFTMLYV